MTEQELKEIMNKDLNEVFNVKSIIDFQFDLLQKAYTEGLETGLKAGRPQWHDLRKDPTDLPKKEGCYLVCMEFNYRHTYILNYGQDDYDDEEKMDWYDDESTHYPKEVIAWCEIPTFDKE